MAKLNTTLRAKTGQKVDADEVRTHCVSVRLNAAELASVNAKRGKYRRGEWLRMAAFDGLPQEVPEANEQLSLRLSKLLGALGSLMQTNKLDAEKEQMLQEIRSEVVKLRHQLEGKNV